MPDASGCPQAKKVHRCTAGTGTQLPSTEIHANPDIKDLGEEETAENLREHRLGPSSWTGKQEHSHEGKTDQGDFTASNIRGAGNRARRQTEARQPGRSWSQGQDQGRKGALQRRTRPGPAEKAPPGTGRRGPTHSMGPERTPGRPAVEAGAGEGTRARDAAETATGRMPSDRVS